MLARRGLAGVGVLVIGLLSATSLSGQALPFHTTGGMTAGFQENAARAFVSIAGRGGLTRDGRTIRDPANRNLDVVAVVAGAIPISLTPLWTTRIVVPWISKSLEFDDPPGVRREFETSGLGDLLVDTKWIFFSDNRTAATTRVGVQAGVEVPVGQTDAELPGGRRAPRPLQVGSGSWDFPIRLIFTDIERRWGFHGNLGYRVNTRDEGFEAGDVFGYDLAVGFRLLPATYRTLRDQTLVAYVELNGRVAGRNAVDGTTDEDSGGHLLLISPDLQWIPLPWLLLETSLQVPIVQELNGEQLEHEVRFQIGSRLRFSVFR